MEDILSKLAAAKTPEEVSQILTDAGVDPSTLTASASEEAGEGDTPVAPDSGAAASDSSSDLPAMPGLDDVGGIGAMKTAAIDRAYKKNKPADAKSA